MKRVLILLLLSLAMISSAQPDDKEFQDLQARAAAAIEKIPAADIKLFLYSLNPERSEVPSGKEFYGHEILFSAEIIPLEEKKELLNAFAKGVRESHGGARCFEPRHGLRVINGSTTNDFVICYECCNIEAYGFGKGLEGFTTSPDPKTVFNKYVDKYRPKYEWIIFPSVVVILSVVIAIVVRKKSKSI